MSRKLETPFTARNEGEKRALTAVTGFLNPMMAPKLDAADSPEVAAESVRVDPRTTAGVKTYTPSKLKPRISSVRLASASGKRLSKSITVFLPGAAHAGRTNVKQSRTKMAR